MRKFYALIIALCLILAILLLNVPDINYGEGTTSMRMPYYAFFESERMPCSVFFEVVSTPTPIYISMHQVSALTYTVMV